jgi:hypothetical protein
MVFDLIRRGFEWRASRRALQRFARDNADLVETALAKSDYRIVTPGDLGFYRGAPCAIAAVTSVDIVTRNGVRRVPIDDLTAYPVTLPRSH